MPTKNLVAILGVLIILLTFLLFRNGCNKPDPVDEEALQEQIDSLSKENHALIALQGELTKKVAKLQEEAIQLVEEKRIADQKYYKLSNNQKIIIVEKIVGGPVQSTDSTITFTYPQLDSINIMASDLNLCEALLNNCSQVNEALVEKNNLSFERHANDSLSIELLTSDRDYWKIKAKDSESKVKKRGKWVKRLGAIAVIEALVIGLTNR